MGAEGCVVQVDIASAHTAEVEAKMRKLVPLER
jgi:hypothetical protein